MTTLVISFSPAIDRLAARLLGRHAIAAVTLSAGADEATLARFPPPAWCASQEANLFVLERLKDVRWHRLIKRIADAEGADPVLLERLVSQSFALGCSRRLEVIRVCMAALDAPSIKLASDLPPAIREAFLAEFKGRVVPAPIMSAVLRFMSAAGDVWHSLLRHAARIVRMVKLMTLPGRPVEPPAYLAWLGALPAEVSHHGPDKLSLAEFLDEARSGSEIQQMVIQGAKLSALPAGLIHRAEGPPLRYRPSVVALVKAVAGQIKQACRLLFGACDFRIRTLIGPVVMDLPSFRMWFAEDRPLAVLYSNAVIGGEPPVALLRQRFGVSSMMTFYSANVSYGHPPAHYAGPVTRLEPEIRFIVADRITMWSETMTEAFTTAGYPRASLVETGPVVFARQKGFIPTSRFITGTGGPTRIGIFDVSVLRPQRRFALGYGQLIYNKVYAETFFRHIFEAAKSCYGEEFVIVRKLKRSLVAVHSDDVDFSRLPSVRIIARDPSESLWKVLEAVDMVLCMPFTSVAYLADVYGIPAAYYDPSGTVLRSPLGGRAALLSDKGALKAWMATPLRSDPRNPKELIGPRVMQAAVSSEWPHIASFKNVGQSIPESSCQQVNTSEARSLRSGAHV